MRALKLLLLVLISKSLFGQAYNIELIEPALRKGADAIIRDSRQEFEIHDFSAATYSVKKAITIFNEDARDLAVFYQTYTGLRKIKKVEIAYYDKNGERLDKVKNSEIEDVNITSSSSLYDDNKVKYYAPPAYEYPFTVEYSFEYDYQSMLYFPEFKPEVFERVGIEVSSYTLRKPKNYEVKYHLLNDVGEPEMSSEEGMDVLRWEVSSRKPKEQEYRGKSIAKLSPHVLLAPTEFAMEGYEGNLKDWNTFGKWLGALNKGRDALSDGTKQEINALVENVASEREKVRLIYEYMQSKTRYVSIQLGIGGFQPFTAQEVIDTGYGDCKALTNYTYSLLKHAGISSNYVAIYGGAGADAIESDFASTQFNHVILAVPMEQDTVWLECTSQVAPFNFLGSFTDNRYGLMVTEDGGVLVKTPKYKAEDSRQSRVINITLSENGDAEVIASTEFTGKQYGQNYWRATEGESDMRKYLLKTIDLPTFNLGSFEYEDIRSAESPVLKETISLNIPKFASKSGSRLFLNPNVLNRISVSPPKDSDRVSPILMDFGYYDIDTVNLSIPEGFRMEFEMEPVSIESEFGSYKLEYSFDNETSTLQFIREIKVNEGVFEAQLYEDFRSFMRDVSKHDRGKIVLSSGT
ncbi:DUF3857 domain-containing protein [Roseivirga pacifica]|uniref:DUF3857 domain-containing protein n=1 Tax=Roseivirga pacifica TaxID=1267423 RepID=UPI003BAFEC62